MLPVSYNYNLLIIICRKEEPIADRRIPYDLRAHPHTSYYIINHCLVNKPCHALRAGLSGKDYHTVAINGSQEADRTVKGRRLEIRSSPFVFVFLCLLCLSLFASARLFGTLAGSDSLFIMRKCHQIGKNEKIQFKEQYLDQNRLINSPDQGCDAPSKQQHLESCLTGFVPDQL